MTKSTPTPVPPLRQTLFAWFSSEEAWLAWLSLAALIALTLASIYLSVRMNHFVHDFYQAINEHRRHAFFTQVGIFFLLVCIIVAEFCTRAYLLSWTSFRWRQWMTHHYQHLWLSEHRFYRLRYSHLSVDNPDQRMAQDIGAISSEFLSLALSLLRAVLSAISFLVILYQLSAPLHIMLLGHRYSLTGILLIAAVLYAVIMTGITIGIAHPLFHLNIEQERREANFRYHLIRIREHSRAIAELEGAPFEERTLLSHFQHIARNYMRILKRTLYLNLFQNFYGNMMPFLPLIIAGPLFFQGTIGFGLLMQIHDVFNRINDSLSIIALSYTDITAWMAAIQRVRHLETALHTLPADQAAPNDTHLYSTTELVLYRPDQTRLWAVPDLTIEAGAIYTIMAPPGTGKSTLLRTLCGLHPHYTGHLRRATGVTTRLLSQNSYLPIGTLAEALFYPHQADEATLAAAYDRLTDFALGHLADHWHTVGDYQQQLSSGEKQRLQCMRLIWQKPDIAFLDEALTHVSSAERDHLIHLIRTHCPQTTLVIVTHEDLSHLGIPSLW